MLLGRGHAVTAETTIRNGVMKRVLKMDPDILFDSWSFFSYCIKYGWHTW